MKGLGWASLCRFPSVFFAEPAGDAFAIHLPLDKEVSQRQSPIQRSERPLGHMQLSRCCVLLHLAANVVARPATKSVILLKQTLGRYGDGLARPLQVVGKVLARGRPGSHDSVADDLHQEGVRGRAPTCKPQGSLQQCPLYAAEALCDYHRPFPCSTRTREDCRFGIPVRPPHPRPGRPRGRPRDSPVRRRRCLDPAPLRD